MYNRLLTREEADKRGLKVLEEGGKGDDNAQVGAPYALLARFWRTSLGVPCIRPPWGGLMAVDLTTREVLWKKPFGSARDHGPLGIPTFLKISVGVPNNGGSAVTAGGLTFISATLDRYLRAFETQTGKMLWDVRLPAGGQATPISYVAGGRQYVVIVAGGHKSMETKIGDYVIAYALPRR